MDNENITQEIVNDIKRVAKSLGIKKLSRSEYLQYSKFSHHQLYNVGRNWTFLCNQAGIIPKTIKEVSDEEYFKRLAKAIKTLGRYPKTYEIQKFGIHLYPKRFPTLKDLIKKAIKLGYVQDLFEKKEYEKKIVDIPTETSDILSFIHSSIKKINKQERPVPPIPLSTKRSKWERTGLSGFPYAPQEEQGVLVLFSILCYQRIIPWQIIDVSAGKGVDAVCYDEDKKKEIQVELKYHLSKSNWNHPIEEIDYVVCWKNKWKNFPKPVIEISKLIKGT